MLVVEEFCAMVVAVQRAHLVSELLVNVHEKRNEMAKHQYGDVKITWPDDNQKFTMKAVDEPEEAAVEFWDIFTQILYIVSIDKKTFDFELEEEKLVPIFEIDYPDNLRIYVNKKRISLTDAHAMVEKGMQHLLRIALDILEKEQ